ncbi:TVP38/TMEM64 family protein [Crenothrix sp.]|uniref:TVP38/TMEM64 family protein n=1 Tax=Crenothrix sp. TaxID=3100433 RepID=UPI00374D6570
MALQNLSLVEKLLIALVFAVVVLWVGHEFKVYLPDLEVWLAELGFFAPLGFVVLFVGLSPLFVSIDVLCFAAGLLFSIVVGELAVIVATYLSAIIIFFLGRYWLRDRVLAFTAKYQKLAILDKLISGDNALKLMFLLRLTPLPFALNFGEKHEDD